MLTGKQRGKRDGDRPCNPPLARVDSIIHTLPPILPKWEKYQRGCLD
jgi:hypothetical protein